MVLPTFAQHGYCKLFTVVLGALQTLPNDQDGGWRLAYAWAKHEGMAQLGSREIAVSEFVLALQFYLQIALLSKYTVLQLNFAF